MARPNFVLIITDTQGASVVGAYNHPGLHTPNIDHLAEEGVRFLRAYTSCPLCTPARAALFTGIYSHTAGPWTNNLALGSNIKNMGQRFQDKGYRTVYIGKWHLDGHDYFGTGISPDGWDSEYWYDGRNYLDELSEEERTLWRGGLQTLEDLQEHDIRAEFTWAHRISDRTIDFLRNRREDEPFVLVASYDEPHHPFTCPRAYVEKFLDYRHDLGPAAFDDLSDKPAHQKEWAEAADLHRPHGWVQAPMYFGCNSFVDAEIGRVLKAVDSFAADNTYVIYVSDHGEMLGAHRLNLKGAAMYEEITHVPFIVRQPDRTLAGTVEPALVSLVDLLPSMMDLAGIEIPEILHGQSIAGLLRGAAPNIDRDVFIEFNRYEIEHDSYGGFLPIRCIISGDWKLVINLLESDELYHLQEDPGEVDNRINDPAHARCRDELHDKLIDWMHRKRDPFRGPHWERRPWQSARRLGWMGKFRPRPRDGYAPDILDYDTGFPSRGTRDQQVQ